MQVGDLIDLVVAFLACCVRGDDLARHFFLGFADQALARQLEDLGIVVAFGLRKFLFRGLVDFFASTGDDTQGVRAGLGEFLFFGIPSVGHLTLSFRFLFLDLLLPLGNCVVDLLLRDAGFFANTVEFRFERSGEFFQGTLSNVWKRAW